MREDGTIDFDDGSKTETPAFLIRSITSITSLSRFPSGPRNESYLPDRRRLWCAAAVSRLTADQTQYHFLSGFTANWPVLSVASPNRRQPSPLASGGIPVAAPDSVRRSAGETYAAAGAQAYLVNTGWNGTGKRIRLKIPAPLSTLSSTVRWIMRNLHSADV